MRANFDEIEYGLVDGCVELAAFDSKTRVMLVVSVNKHRLMEWFADEFVTYRKKVSRNNAPEYIPDGGELTLYEWYSEFMCKKKAWQIFGEIPVGEGELITND